MFINAEFWSLTDFPESGILWVEPGDLGFNEFPHDRDAHFSSSAPI